jgi:hypothetical protein
MTIQSNGTARIPVDNTSEPQVTCPFHLVACPFHTGLHPPWEISTKEKKKKFLLSTRAV